MGTQQGYRKFKSLRLRAYEFLFEFRSVKSRYGHIKTIIEYHHDGKKVQIEQHLLNKTEPKYSDLQKFWCVKCTSTKTRLDAFLSIIFGDHRKDNDIFINWEFGSSGRFYVPCLILRYLCREQEYDENVIKSFIATMIVNTKEEVNFNNRIYIIFVFNFYF